VGILECASGPATVTTRVVHPALTLDVPTSDFSVIFPDVHVERRMVVVVPDDAVASRFDRRHVWDRLSHLITRARAAGGFSGSACRSPS